MANKWIEIIIDLSVFMIEYLVNILDLTQQILRLLCSDPLVEFIKFDLFPHWHVVFLLPVVEIGKYLVLHTCFKYSINQVAAKNTEL